MTRNRVARYRNACPDQTISFVSKCMGTHRQNSHEYQSCVHALWASSDIFSPQSPLSHPLICRNCQIRISLLLCWSRSRGYPITHYLWSFSHYLNHAHFSGNTWWSHGKKQDTPRTTTFSPEEEEILEDLLFFLPKEFGSSPPISFLSFYPLA